MPQRNQAPIETTASLNSPQPTESATKKIEKLQEDFEKEIGNGELTKARILIEDIGQISKSSKEYHEGLSRLLIRSRDYEAAKVALKECLKQYPKSKSCLSDLSTTEGFVGTRDEQARAAEHCLSIAPNYPPCLNDLAITRMNQNRFAEAVKIYEYMIRTNGDMGFRFEIEMLYSQIGYALKGAGRFAEARENFDRACQAQWPGACDMVEELSPK